MTVRPLFLVAALVLPPRAIGQLTLFYGGDANYLGGLWSTRSFGTANVYDDFDIGPNGAVITGVYGTFLWSIDSTEAEYEIRSGVSEGNGGSLIASGVAPSTDVDSGQSQGQDHYWTVSVSGLHVSLRPGRYWVSVAPYSPYMSAVLLTSGRNAIGSPIGDGNSFVSWPAQGWNFASTSDSDLFGPGNWDFSFGVVGEPVPEPTPLVGFGVTLALLLCRRRFVRLSPEGSRNAPATRFRAFS